MNKSLRNELSDCIEQLANPRWFGVNFIFNGKKYEAIKKTRNVKENQGYQTLNSNEIYLEVPLRQLGSDIPSKGDSLIIDGVYYRIASVEMEEFSVNLRLNNYDS